MSWSEYDVTCQINIIGEPFSGKTSLLTRMGDYNNYDNRDGELPRVGDPDPHIGARCKYIILNKIVELIAREDDDYKFPERSQWAVRRYRNIDIIIVCVDATNPIGRTMILREIAELHRYGRSGIMMAFVITKCDLVDKKTINEIKNDILSDECISTHIEYTERGFKFESDPEKKIIRPILCYETSAKDQNSITTMIRNLISEFLMPNSAEQLIEIQKETFFVMACAQHPRLGKKSPMKYLNPFLLRDIALLVSAEDPDILIKHPIHATQRNNKCTLL
jgi:GTPase SAR1 family protein